MLGGGVVPLTSYQFLPVPLGTPQGFRSGTGDALAEARGPRERAAGVCPVCSYTVQLTLLTVRQSFTSQKPSKKSLAPLAPGKGLLFLNTITYNQYYAQ